MFRRVIFNASFKRNYLVITGKVKQNGISNNLKFKLCLPQFSEAHLTQSRFCSTNSSGSGLHKVFFVNAESPPATDQTESLTASNSIEYIPPPPLPPDITEESLNTLNALGEPTFESLGLAGWSPIGLLQSGIEHLHVTLGLPWWGSIVVATVIMRMCLSPLVVMSQRNAAKMNNHMPTIQHIQMKLTEARNSGNHLEAARLGYEMQQFMKKADINPIRSMLVPLAQAPIFISMFIGLRRCANLPVESFKEGGMLWFTDLTLNDPFYILPVVTSLTMLATIELGAEGQQVSNQTSKLARTFLRALPLIIFPFTLHFPSAILCYWVSTNFCSLLQVGVLRIPKVRNYFGINPLIRHNPDMLPGNKKGIIAGMKESWSNMKISAEIDERQRLDEVNFKKAGMGPLVKTYRHNPVRKNVIDVKAKAKD